MSATPEMTAYYARRAREYEEVYAKPERQVDLTTLRARVAALLAGRRVFEVACGTGYWTQFVAQQAAAIYATDYNQEVLAIARAKPLPEDRVTFARADAFALPPPPFPCDAGLAAFWWSHVRRGPQLNAFLRGFFAQLRPHARFVLLDNRYVAGSSTPVARTDGDGNTFQTRTLADGSQHEVLKNFPTEAEVRAALATQAVRIHWEPRDYYWLAWGELH